MNAGLNENYDRIFCNTRILRAWWGGVGKDQKFIFCVFLIQIDKKISY